MSLGRSAELLREFKSELLGCAGIQQILELITDFVSEYLRCDQVLSSLAAGGSIYRSSYSSLQKGSPSSDSQLFTVSNEGLEINSAVSELPLFIGDRERRRVPQLVLKSLRENGINSMALLPIASRGEPIGVVEVRFYGNYHRWSAEERFTLDQAAQYVSFALDGLKHFSGNGHGSAHAQSAESFREQLSQTKPSERYERLAKYGEVVIIRTGADFRMQEITGQCKEILGFYPHELIGDVKAWRRFLHPADFRRLQRRLAKLRHKPQDMVEEVRVVGQNGGTHRWLLLKYVPLIKDGTLAGWEGFGIDITERHQAQEELFQQSRRIEALYEVSRATQLHSDPAVVMLKGLKALISATDSDCGYGCFYDSASGRIEIVAVDGLSQEYVDQVQKRINESQIVKEVIASKRGVMFDNIQDEPRALTEIVVKEGLRATIVVPMLSDEEVFGALVLYCKEQGRYKQADFELVASAASQICISMKQAETYNAEKQHADSLAILYKISHELSKYVSAKEVAERAFPLIQRQIMCKRLWLGILNEQGTHIVGQAGFGPGVRRRITNIQVELYLRHDFLDEALRTKRPIIVPENQKMECSGLNNIMRRLNVGAFVVVPLISLAQVVGVLVVEPASPALHAIERKLPILTSMANEIGTVLLARRFEAKMAEADKMRMAGMLASGVAHNFNNLLQAVMGQASLLEMQLPKESPMSKSARMIVDAAGKGASLITQLLSFSASDTHKRRNIGFDNLLTESRDLYRSILGSEIKLEVECSPDIPQVLADFGQVQQVMTNLLINAKEALTSRSDGLIKISAAEVRLKSGEVDPELAPGTYVRIDVEDNGVGMDAEKQARCFEPFFTSKNVDSRTGLGFSGSGLGLSSAYSIMKQHDGLIVVRSGLGEGSVFSLFFPIVSGKHVEMNHDMLYAGVANDSLDVMIFDLDDAITASVRPILESVGLRSVATNKENRALELLRRPASTVRAALLDVDKTGYDMLPFIRTLRKDFTELLLVVYTRDPRRWGRLLQTMSRVDIIEKPLGVWGIHSLARRIASYKKVVGLGAKLQVDKENSEIVVDEAAPEVMLSPENEKRE